MPQRLVDMDEQELAFFMRELARAVVSEAEDRDVEPPRFVLLVFNDPKVAQYVANCERSDIITALRDTADRLQQKQDVTR